MRREMGKASIEGGNEFVAQIDREHRRPLGQDCTIFLERAGATVLFGGPPEYRSVAEKTPKRLTREAAYQAAQMPAETFVGYGDVPAHRHAEIMRAF